MEQHTSDMQGMDRDTREQVIPHLASFAQDDGIDPALANQLEGSNHFKVEEMCTSSEQRNKRQLIYEYILTCRTKCMYLPSVRYNNNQRGSVDNSIPQINTAQTAQIKGILLVN